MIEFRGLYRYTTPMMLDDALVQVRQQLDSPDCVEDVDWMDCFSKHGSTLYVHAKLAADAHAYFADQILRTLAVTAVQGAVEALTEGKPHEYYFVEALARRSDERVY